MNRLPTIVLGIAGVLSSNLVFAGTFLRTVKCSLADGCEPGHPEDHPTFIINDDGIVYPSTYNPNGSTNVRVCVDPDFGGRLPEMVEWAAAKWSALVPTTENCFSCEQYEVPPPTVGTFNAASTVLHELGHCAMGLGHTTIIIRPPLPLTPPPPRQYMSWTISYGASRQLMFDGADEIRGSKDDFQDAVDPDVVTNTFWYRIADNNPAIVDATVISSATYTYSLSNLSTSGSTWPANANYGVTTYPLGLGDPGTVATMETPSRRGQVRFDLSADDVNMVKMSRTGENRVVGGSPTNDDHAIQIEIVPCTESYDLRVLVLETQDPSALGECSVAIHLLHLFDPPVSAQAYRLTSPAIVRINPLQDWNLKIPVFWNGFEAGNTARWSATEP